MDAVNEEFVCGRTLVGQGRVGSVRPLGPQLDHINRLHCSDSGYSHMR